MLLPGQESCATLTGTVTDTQGAIDPNAHIEATNLETNIAQTVETNTAGVYVNNIQRRRSRSACRVFYFGEPACTVTARNPVDTWCRGPRRSLRESRGHQAVVRLRTAIGWRGVPDGCHLFGREVMQSLPTPVGLRRNRRRAKNRNRNRRFS